jgi:hypothetical protein
MHGNMQIWRFLHHGFCRDKTIQGMDAKSLPAPGAQMLLPDPQCGSAAQ